MWPELSANSTTRCIDESGTPNRTNYGSINPEPQLFQPLHDSLHTCSGISRGRTWSDFLSSVCRCCVESCWCWCWRVSSLSVWLPQDPPVPPRSWRWLTSPTPRWNCPGAQGPTTTALLPCTWCRPGPPSPSAGSLSEQVTAAAAPDVMFRETALW